MPPLGTSDTVALHAIKLCRTADSPLGDGKVHVDLIVSIREAKDRVASITLKAWEVKPNKYLSSFVSLTFTFDTQPALTLFVNPAHIEWAQAL